MISKATPMHKVNSIYFLTMLLEKSWKWRETWKKDSIKSNTEHLRKNKEVVDQTQETEKEKKKEKKNNDYIFLL